MRCFNNCLVFLITLLAKQRELLFVFITELAKLVFFFFCNCSPYQFFLSWFIPHPLSFFITESQNTPRGIPEVLIRGTRHKSGFIAAVKCLWDLKQHPSTVAHNSNICSSLNLLDIMKFTGIFSAHESSNAFLS